MGVIYPKFNQQIMRNDEVIEALESIHMYSCLMMCQERITFQFSFQILTRQISRILQEDCRWSHKLIHDSVGSQSILMKWQWNIRVHAVLNGIPFLNKDISQWTANNSWSKLSLLCSESSFNVSKMRLGQSLCHLGAVWSIDSLWNEIPSGYQFIQINTLQTNENKKWNPEI